MTAVPEIRTERLLLRGARRQDFEPFAAVVMEPGRPGGAVDRRTAWRMFNAGLGQWVMDGIGHWAIEERETGAFAGSIGAFHREPRPGPCDPAEIELGWSISASVRGRGFATEAARAVVAYAFATKKVAHVVAYIDHDNPSSIRVAEKLGMKYERDVDFYETRLRRYVLTATTTP